MGKPRSRRGNRIEVLDFFKYILFVMFSMPFYPYHFISFLRFLGTHVFGHYLPKYKQCCMKFGNAAIGGSCSEEESPKAEGVSDT